MRDALPNKHIPTPLFFRGQKHEVDRLLKRSDTYVLCNEEDPSQIYSFAVTERLQGELIIHFAYTKSFYWKMGLMRKLLNSIEPDLARKGAVVTFFAPCFSDEKWSNDGGSFWIHLRDKYKFVFNPFLKELT